jgi:hypothetical protein
MSRYDIEIIGLDVLTRLFQDAPEQWASLMEQVSSEAMDVLRGSLASYPPPRNYIRTGTLSSGWTSPAVAFSVGASGFEATLTNPTPYGPDVQGPGTQAPIHQGYWKTTQDILDDQEPYITVAFVAALATLAEQLGGA